ncbi:MAG: DUF484 family protein [Dokdonella sp.]|uniref:DUF484 family protein n=1 Tax=Dokdonella sp. TaxID=2291710 RepID=UPI003266B76D
MSELSVKDSLNAMDVASYLRRHPQFLGEFPDIAMTLMVPREQGPAASLASYQLDVLRDKNRDLSRRLHDLIEIAHENESLMVRVHTLTLAQMRATTLADTVRAVVGALTEDFHPDLVRLVLFRADPDLPAAEWLIAEPDGVAAFPAFAEFFKRAEPLCGRLQQDKLDVLFGKHADDARSAVLLPISDIGMLAVGSHDENRFHPGMGTVFLKLIGEAVSTALARFPIRR